MFYNWNYSHAQSLQIHTYEIKRLRARLLTGKGAVTHDDAIAKAEAEFEIYRAREMRQLKSDFDKAVGGYLREGDAE